MPIDMHSHYYGGLIEHLEARRSPPNISIDTQGRQVLNAMTASTVVSAGYTDVPSRLAYLDEASIRAQLMTFPGALGVDVMPAEEVEVHHPRLQRPPGGNLPRIGRPSHGARRPSPRRHA